MSFRWLYLVKCLVLVSDWNDKIVYKIRNENQQQQGPTELNLCLKFLVFFFLSSHPQGDCAYANAIVSIFLLSDQFLPIPPKENLQELNKEKLMFFHNKIK